MAKGPSHLLLMTACLVLLTVSLSGCIDSVERTGWAYEKTQITDMNDQGFFGTGVIIAIIDTGVNTGHPDLKGLSIIAWRDFINEEPDPYDDRGHGTHIAGIIGANGEIKGGAYKADFVIAKALDDQGRAEDGVVANAIDWCADQGADIICLSLGGDPVLPRLGEQSGIAAREVISRGTIVVAAAGNDGKDEDDSDVNRPANVPGVIAVGAVDKELKIAPFSSIGDNDGITPFTIDDRFDPDKKPEVVAPGVDIRSTYLNKEYAVASGTSQATPLVVAGIALILEDNPMLQRDGDEGGDSAAVEKIKEAIMLGAYQIPGQDTPHDDHYGYGLFRAADSSALL
jgi:subtilisin family serine protease